MSEVWVGRMTDDATRSRVHAEQAALLAEKVLEGMNRGRFKPIPVGSFEYDMLRLLCYEAVEEGDPDD